MPKTVEQLENELITCRAEQARLQAELLKWESRSPDGDGQAMIGVSVTEAQLQTAPNAKFPATVPLSREASAHGGVTTPRRSVDGQTEAGSEPADSHHLAKLAAQVSTLTAELEGLRRFVSGEQLGVSTGIDGEPTYGYGHLDVHGFWEFPVSEDCAAFNRRQHTLTAALRRLTEIWFGGDKDGLVREHYYRDPDNPSYLSRCAECDGEKRANKYCEHKASCRVGALESVLRAASEGAP